MALRFHLKKFIPFVALFLGQPILLPSLYAQTQALSLNEKAPLILAQGEQRLLRIPGLVKYSISSKVIHITSLSRHFAKASSDQRDSLLIKGMLPGLSDLWVWKKDGTSEYRLIRVEKVSSADLSPAVQKAVSKLEEAEVVYSGKGVVLRGEISSLKEAGKIGSLLLYHPKEVADETLPAEALLIDAKAKLEEWLTPSKYQTKVV